MILLTGGRGRLGSELRRLIPESEIYAPPREVMNITCLNECAAVIKTAAPRIVIHAAAYTKTWQGEQEQDACRTLNVEGTRNIASVCGKIGTRLVYISTDCVFPGDRGQYTVDDPVGPMNFYGLTKWRGEQHAKEVADHLIIRTSFRVRPWPYPQAPIDAFTSGDYVDVIAPLLLKLAISEKTGIVHLGTGRRSLFDLARESNPDVAPCLRAEMPQPPAYDLSLI